jgi:hypothetical protein
VNSNSNWTVVSDQTWCLPTPSGSGNGTIAANYSQNPSSASRLATLTITVSGVPPSLVTITQDGTVGISEISASDIILMPNPNNGLFSIKGKNLETQKLTITISDNSGRTILSKEYNGSNSYEFDLRNYAKGTYIVKIISGSKIILKKLVIK